MSRATSKLILILAWLGAVFGFLYLLQMVYEKEPSFFLFVLLAVSGNVAYDGLKSIISYQPFYQSDAKEIVKDVLWIIASFPLAAAWLLGVASLYHYHFLGNLWAQAIGGGGFLGFIALGAWKASAAENRFKLSNRA